MLNIIEKQIQTSVSCQIDTCWIYVLTFFVSEEKRVEHILDKQDPTRVIMLRRKVRGIWKSANQKLFP